MADTKTIGTEGEDSAAEWLLGQGFEIVARNWRDGRYELDIVARRGGTIHFVEVKTRGVDGWQSPEEAMNAAKQRSFKRAVRSYLGLYPTDLEVQMDLVAVDNIEGFSEVRYVPEAVICRW